MSFLKINKLMLVVTIRRGDFFNSVFVNPGICSRAVDAFLEISTHLCQIYVLGNECTEQLFNVCSHYQTRGQL